MIDCPICEQPMYVCRVHAKTFEHPRWPEYDEYKDYYKLVCPRCKASLCCDNPFLWYSVETIEELIEIGKRVKKEESKGV